MSAFKTDTQNLVSRIPWKEFLKDQLFKLIGFLILSILIIGTIIYSGKMTNIDSILTGELTDLELAIQDQNSLITIILSTFCFLLVLIGFSKILLFDMAEEFGLRDEETHKIKFDLRFFLFAALAISSIEGFSTAYFFATFLPFNFEKDLSKYIGQITYLSSPLETIIITYNKLILILE